LISFGRIFSDVYFSFIEATKRERTTEISAFITKLQYNQLGRFPVIYISSLNAHFLVTEITGFDGESMCKLKVVKYG